MTLSGTHGLRRLSLVALLLAAVPAGAAAKVNEAAEEACAAMFREKFGAVDVTEVEVHHRNPEERFVHATVKAADGSTARYRCLYRPDRGSVMGVDVYDPAAASGPNRGWVKAKARAAD